MFFELILLNDNFLCFVYVFLSNKQVPSILTVLTCVWDLNVQSLSHLA